MLRFLQSPPWHGLFSVVSFLYHIALPAALFYIGHGLHH